MKTGPLFKVGNFQVDRTEVNPELVRKMAASAPKIDLEGNVSAKAWTELADRVEKQDEISPEDLKQLEELGKGCFKHHRQLHSELKASAYKDAKIKSELQDVHVFQSGSDRIRESLMVAQATVSVQAMAGASFGPTGLVSAFAAYARLQQQALQPLVDEVQGLRDGTSSCLYQGNKTQGFHAEAIWKQMNDMLDGAAASAKAGKPEEVNAQYYELTNQQIVGKLAAAAEAGCKVRVNVDAGRLVAYKGSHVVIDEVPDKLRSILQLSAVKGDVGVSTYPVVEKLGDPGDLMHRKGLRVGDKFLLSGVNANEGSGENVDAGYLIEGPAAKRLVQNFARDVNDSAGATNEQVYGEKPLAEFLDGDINMGPRGLIALWDCMDGPSPAGTQLPKASTLLELKQIGAKNGHRVSEFVSCTAEEAETLIAQGRDLPLNAKGKAEFLKLVDRTLGATREPKNIKRLKDIEVPKGDPAGTTAIALADVPTEREAVMLTAIQNADKFIYIPAFVMTRAVASMIVAKRDEMRAQGKELDIRVLADPGIYPDGGTPNEAGVEFLEDNGVPVRWAKLVRSGDHDRKIHAKECLTDKGEFFGSTNFSNKGLMENWEHSGYVEFDESDPASVKQRDEAVAKFMDLWDHESFDLNSLEKGKEMRSRSLKDKDYEQQADEARFGVVRGVLRGVDSFEKASATFVEEQAKDPKTAARIAELFKQGYDEGMATLMAVREKMGDDAFYGALAEMPESARLEGLK